jgi:hypothetical protein
MGGVVVQYLKSERLDEKVRMHGYDWDMLASTTPATFAFCIRHARLTTRNYTLCAGLGEGNRVVFWNSGVIG